MMGQIADKKTVSPERRGVTSTHATRVSDH